MKRLLADIRALRDEYRAEYTLGDDIASIVWAFLTIVGLIIYEAGVLAMMGYLHG